MANMCIMEQNCWFTKAKKPESQLGDDNKCELINKFQRYQHQTMPCWTRTLLLKDTLSLRTCRRYINQKWRTSLRWRHNGLDSVSNHQPPGCLLNRLFRRKSKKTSKLRVTGLCAGNSPGTGEFSAQMASYAENVSIWWRHHDTHGTCPPFYWWIKQ